LGFKDNDSDAFGIQLTYQWEGGGFAFGAAYVRDVADPYVESDYAIFINPAFVQSFQGTWGEFAIHFEGKFGWGERAFSRYFLGEPNTFDNTMDSKGIGIYLDGVWTYGDGAGDITLATWYVSGTDSDPRNYRDNAVVPVDNKTLVSMGDFAPFLVAHNGVTLGTGIFSNTFGGIVFDQHCEDYAFCDQNYGLVNQWGIAILGNHKLTPEIAVNYGIGYFRLVEPALWWHLYTRNGVATYQSQSTDLGWEIDIGFTFQLYEHLSFETQFGYMFNGDAYSIYEPAENVADLGTWHSPHDTFAWANVIAFTF
ncbi:MAG: hypothetical protein LBE38_12320, partial [Deltaproteobacteria bacterium]|nr:hypothetical protein [Deltaproteobacteria bacterium]